MHHMQRALAAAVLTLTGVTAWAGEPLTNRDVLPTEGATSTSTGRWSAEWVPAGQISTLVIHDGIHGRQYRLTDFEGAPVEGFHWLGPTYLEVDFPDHTALLHVRAPSHTAEPTFHLVTSEFNVAGAGRVDYYSPPLVALNDGRAGRKTNNDIDH